MSSSSSSEASYALSFQFQVIFTSWLVVCLVIIDTLVGIIGLVLLWKGEVRDNTSFQFELEDRARKKYKNKKDGLKMF
jgi:hypothetical protein